MTMMMMALVCVDGKEVASVSIDSDGMGRLRRSCTTETAFLSRTRGVDTCGVFCLCFFFLEPVDTLEASAEILLLFFFVYPLKKLDGTAYW